MFDENPRVGGRKATRHVDGLQFNRGPHCFSAPEPEFPYRIRRWLQAGLIAEWGKGDFVVSPGTSSLARTMADRVHRLTGGKVACLKRAAAEWWLQTDADLVGSGRSGASAAVILATPAPQA